MNKSISLPWALGIAILSASCAPVINPVASEEGAADLSSPRPDDASVDLPTVSVTIETTGSGRGEVKNPLLPQSCASRCILKVAAGSVLQLSAVADADSFVGSWQGACTGPAATCSVTVTHDQTVQVSFRRWSAQPSGVTATLRSIWGRSATDVWAVGSSSTVLHYDGTSWNPTNLGVPLDRTLNGVYGDSGSLFTVGDRATLLRFSTDRWVAETVEGGLRADANLYAIWSAGGGVAFAAGANGLILRRTADGKWHHEPLDPGEDLVGVWGSSATDAWVAGGRALLHFTASGWRAADSPEPTIQYRSLGGSGAAEIWAGATLSRIHRFDGSRWTRELTYPSSGDPVLAIATALKNEVYVLSGFQGEVYRGAAGAWAKTPQPVGNVPLLGAWSLASGETWIVGDRGTILHTLP